jgi:hypothetical protein
MVLGEKGKYEPWLHGFVLPLVAGGDVRVSGVMGQRELDELIVDPWITSQRDERVHRIAEARHAVVSELLIDPFEPELEDESLTLAVAMQNLLFLSHPGTAGAFVRRSKLRQVAEWSALKVRALPEPETVRELAERHSMLHHLFDLGRDDVRVSFWAGRREFRGAEPPSRLLKWATVRRVREERWRVSFLTEAVTDPGQRAIVLALLAASPLTDLLEPLRLDPQLELKPLARWLREPLVARAVADRYLSIGFAQLGGPLTAALLALYNQKNVAHEAQIVTRFFCHLHLLRIIGPRERGAEFLPELQAMLAGQPNLRDFYGLFAAAQRVGMGRPDDLALDAKLSKLVDGYAAACATLCGPARVLELEALMARGVQQMLLGTG